MPYLSIRGTRLYYEDTGGTGEPVLFSHGLLWDSRLFREQVSALRGRYRCIVYDHRGQGHSEPPPGGSPIDLRTVYEDAVAVIQALGLAPCHFVGQSMGGFVGLRVAARHPELLRSLSLLDSSAAAELPLTLARYRLLTTLTHWLGVRPVVDRIMSLYFGRTFMRDPEREAERASLRRQLVDNPREVWRAMQGVIHRRSVEGELHRIVTPTLVMVGDEDLVTVPEAAARLHQRIQDSRLVTLPCGGHMCILEQPEAVNAALVRFLETMRMPSWAEARACTVH
ncbi:alpha/beta fold hydrolase [Corallococcus llansteffanensis]|uniref:Alpha/beta hydrolase n=1 Tax=Corallococcus llansteffanensis TaxID=2316731 RepID=A0A3A8PGN8_9BACT|nr:alpha/beta hydrolase [Corallococcus llansteffanensis]RKH53771.1 alpha/beta hydrolase [Corallococcus llansteffanensis]